MDIFWHFFLHSLPRVVLLKICVNNEHSALALIIPQTEYHVLSLLGKKCEFQANNYHLKAEPHKNQKPGP